MSWKCNPLERNEETEEGMEKGGCSYWGLIPSYPSRLPLSSHSNPHTFFLSFCTLSELKDESTREKLLKEILPIPHSSPSTPCRVLSISISIPFKETRKESLTFCFGSFHSKVSPKESFLFPWNKNSQGYFHLKLKWIQLPLLLHSSTNTTWGNGNWTCTIESDEDGGGNSPGKPMRTLLAL